MQYGFPYCIFDYLRLLPGLPETLGGAFFVGALGAGFLPVGLTGALAAGFPAGLPLTGALGGGAV